MVVPQNPRQNRLPITERLCYYIPVAEQIKKKRGGQPGNLNARRHGFYSKCLDRAMRQEMRAASELSGLDMEIAVLRMKIAAILRHDPRNFKLLIQALGTLARMLQLKYRLGTDDEQKLADALKYVVKEVFQPLGTRL